MKRVPVTAVYAHTGMHAHTHECMLDALASKLCNPCNRGACAAAALWGVLVASQPTIFGFLTLQAATKKSILHARHTIGPKMMDALDARKHPPDSPTTLAHIAQRVHALCSG